ncbi:MAG: hypothetical protein K8U03_06660 [Planctomycetia bacterium]|nr:hypothetical protein [Planctomycetia bacterium]
MSDDLTTLRLIRDQTRQLLLDVTLSPKPSYSIDGQSVSWEAYLARIQTTLDWCDAKLNDAEPFEFATRGGT